MASRMIVSFELWATGSSAIADPFGPPSPLESFSPVDSARTAVWIPEDVEAEAEAEAEVDVPRIEDVSEVDIDESVEEIEEFSKRSSSTFSSLTVLSKFKDEEYALGTSTIAKAGVGAERAAIEFA